MTENEIMEILEAEAQKGMMMIPIKDIPLSDLQRLGFIIDYNPKGKKVNISDMITYPDNSYGSKLQAISREAREKIFYEFMNVIRNANIKKINIGETLQNDYFLLNWYVLQFERAGYKVSLDDDSNPKVMILK